jgi:hypothetical protein
LDWIGLARRLTIAPEPDRAPCCYRTCCACTLARFLAACLPGPALLGEGNERTGDWERRETDVRKKNNTDLLESSREKTNERKLTSDPSLHQLPSSSLFLILSLFCSSSSFRTLAPFPASRKRPTVPTTYVQQRKKEKKQKASQP